jgi:hypothetical protein
VVPGHPADRAWIEPGDRIVTVEDQAVATLFAWWIAAETARIGRPSFAAPPAGNDDVSTPPPNSTSVSLTASRR